MNKEVETFLQAVYKASNNLTDYLNKTGNPDLTSKELFTINLVLEKVKTILGFYKKNKEVKWWNTIL